MSCLEVVRSYVAACDRADWDAVRALFHPDARIVTVVRGSRALTPDETLGAIKRAYADAMYTPGWSGIEAIDDDAAIAAGSVRYTLPGGGMGGETRCWLFTVVDGLIYRVLTLVGAEEARAVYARDGIELGIPPAGSP